MISIMFTSSRHLLSVIVVASASRPYCQGFGLNLEPSGEGIGLKFLSNAGWHQLTQTLSCIQIQPAH